MQDSNLNLLTSRIIEAAISVHTELGPGLLESVYSAAMVIELGLMGIDAKSEISVPVFYRGNKDRTQRTIINFVTITAGVNGRF